MAAGILFLAGCATYPPPRETIPDSQIYSNSFNIVWEAVLETLDEQNIEVKSIGKQSGVIVAEDRSIELHQYEPGRYDSQYCLCGSPPKEHVLRDPVGKYRVSVTPAFVGTTSVRIDVSYEAAIYSDDQIMGQHACFSKGVFEPFFLTQIQSRLTSRNTSPPPPPPKVEKKMIPPNLDWWKPSRGY